MLIIGHLIYIYILNYHFHDLYEVDIFLLNGMENFNGWAHHKNIALYVKRSQKKVIDISQFIGERCGIVKITDGN